MFITLNCEYIYSWPLGTIRGERSVCFSVEIYLSQGILLNNLSFPHYLEIPPVSHVFCGNGFCFTELPALLGASSEQRVPAQPDCSRGRCPGSGLPSCPGFVTSDSDVVFSYPSFVIINWGDVLATLQGCEASGTIPVKRLGQQLVRTEPWEKSKLLVLRGPP